VLNARWLQRLKEKTNVESTLVAAHESKNQCCNESAFFCLVSALESLKVKKPVLK
jgi:hypothetical protein